MPRIKLSREADSDHDIPLPSYETDGAAGADIRANLPISQRHAGLTLEPGARALVPTGLRAAIPPGFEIQVRARSGLALRQGLTVANAPGTIDSDYRGPLGVILINLGANPAVIHHGDRVAQIVVAPVLQMEFEAVDRLDETKRGKGGFGSTGVG